VFALFPVEGNRSVDYELLIQDGAFHMPI